MKNTVKDSDNFIKNNIILFFGSMIVAVLNYLYHPILGRMLKVEDFGEVQAFISFVLIFGVFSGIFKNVITNIVANYQGQEDKKTVLMLQKVGLYFAFFISFILLLFGSHFVGFFNFSTNYFFVALSALIIMGVLFSTRQAIVQGLHDFKALSISGIIQAGGKLLFAVFLVYIGLAVFGAISALILAQLAAFIYLIIICQKKFNLGGGWKIKIDGRIKKELWYALLVFSSALSVTFLYAGDVIIVKKYFSPETAGFYSGIATIGRIIVFITGSVAAVLLASIKIGSKENKKILFKAVAINFLIGGGALLTFLLFPDIITRFLIGSRYLEYAHLLPKISLFLFIVSLSNLLFFYLLALRKKFVLFPAFVGPLTAVFYSLASHTALENIISAFLLGGSATLLLLVLKIIFELFKQNKYEKINLHHNSGP